jgi:hypothetical protein
MMDSEYISEDIKRLTFNLVKALFERTGGNLKVPVKFIEIYNEACRRRAGSKNDYDESDLKMIQYIRDELLKKGYIMADSIDVESIYLTQKAIEEYSDY